MEIKELISKGKKKAGRSTKKQREYAADLVNAGLLPTDHYTVNGNCIDIAMRRNVNNASAWEMINGEQTSEAISIMEDEMEDLADEFSAEQYREWAEESEGEERELYLILSHRLEQFENSPFSA